MPTQAQPAYYPKADRTVQNFGQGNSTMGSITKILLHSTETQDWPAYGGAGGHPTLTYNPWRHEWRQHLPIRGSATALMNAGRYQTNRANVLQVEIVGYADPRTAAKYGHPISGLDDQALADLGDFIAWMHTNYGVKIASTVAWKPYPASYGAGNGVRLSVLRFALYRGVLGHQHAPGNYHGDPGDIAIDTIIAHAEKAAGTPPKPTKRGRGKGWLHVTAGPRRGRWYRSPRTVSVRWINDRRRRHLQGSEVFSRHIWFLQHWLNMAGYRVGSTGYWDDKTQALYDQFRRDAGWTGADATGSVGAISLNQLRAKAHATKKVSG